MDLDIVEAGSLGPLRRCDEGRRDRGDPVAVERFRDLPAVGVGNRGRGDCRPGIIAFAERQAALPRHMHRRLAAGVGELNAEAGTRRRDPSRRRERPRRRGLVVVAVEAEAAMGDAAAPFHAGRLDGDEAGPRHGEHHPVLDVPVGGRAVIGRVLAHGRDGNAVSEFYAPNTKRLK